MQLHTIPRTSVTAALQTVRLPISTIERLTGHDGDDAWPPALAFDGFAASVEQIVGSMVHDDELVQRGRLRQTRVAEMREAVRLETLAERADDDAIQTFHARRQADERRRREASMRARKREADAEREEREAAAEVDTKIDARKAQARQTEADRKQALAKKQRTTKKSSINKERQAVGKAKAAATAKSRALDADKKIRATKASRRSA